MKNKFTCVLAVMLCAGLPNVYAADYFVAMGGSGNAGTADAPFSTLARGLSAANDAIDNGGEPTATVHLADGTYDITDDSEPLLLDHAAEPRTVCVFETGKGNPRNGEGDFVRLNDGGICFAYAKFVGKNQWDDTPATIMMRTSRDEGETWSEDREIIKREAKLNVMSVSFLRLDAKRIAIFYLRKNSASDCTPYMRVTNDDFKTLGEPKRLMAKDDTDYYVCNNARAVRMKSGRIALPLARHSGKIDGKSSIMGRLSCLYSNDSGETWKKGGEYVVTDKDGKRVYVQEPGLVELDDGRLYMYARTNRGRQWQMFSRDGGETWGDFGPSPIVGPRGPATIIRLKSGKLLLVWNDHEGREYLLKRGPKWLAGMRAPLTTAISHDEGKSWVSRRLVETDEKGFYCYFAAFETTDDSILLHYYDKPYLTSSRMKKIPLKWVFGETEH